MILPDESRDVIGKSQEIWNWLVHPPQNGRSPPPWYRVDDALRAREREPEKKEPENPWLKPSLSAY